MEQFRPMMMRPVSVPLIWMVVGMKVPLPMLHRDSPPRAMSGFALIQT